MNPVVQFRRAEPRDAPVLTAIALAAKQHWGYPDEWLAEWRSELTVTPEYLRDQPVRLAEVAGEVVGFAGLWSRGSEHYLEHLWVRPEQIGRGFGRALFQEMVREAQAAGIRELRIRSDPHAEAFYRKMGAVRTGQEVYQLLGKFRREVPLLVYPIQ